MGPLGSRTDADVVLVVPVALAVLLRPLLCWLTGVTIPVNCSDGVTDPQGPRE